ncbi:nucleotidyltransferase domain-containing protein [Brevibacillus composti]|jgi:predicted nucleotidyltransferase|uniref:Nucleotidyltransferase domain-containing protein n=1 Tax=Brevibacillus composti TaxID=2796470 RepID=A0A7T5EKF8_9BACL|nr:nucleotidyltransferase domain-containing protein [Brevibacillus composti]QQE74166.1 nucleotidyltransferase domain-containing protein [Brevibacillus composti]QUO41249.1 nucleotidyltransferase domain-containing protein [Brevibacillus composti]
MAAIPAEVKRVVEEYVRNISQLIPVKKAVLFGSYAKGTFDEGSDVDLAIFSDYFEQMDRVEGIKFLLMHAMDYHVDLEPIAFTEKEYAMKEGIVGEILKTGVEIAV